jgi:hypothetical protein
MEAGGGNPFDIAIALGGGSGGGGGGKGGGGGGGKGGGGGGKGGHDKGKSGGGGGGGGKGGGGDKGKSKGKDGDKGKSKSKGGHDKGKSSSSSLEALGANLKARLIDSQTNKKARRNENISFFGPISSTAVGSAQVPPESYGPWQVKTDTAWEMFSPGMHFLGVMGSEIRYNRGKNKYKAVFATTVAGTQTNLSTGTCRPLRRAPPVRREQIARQGEAKAKAQMRQLIHGSDSGREQIARQGEAKAKAQMRQLIRGVSVSDSE